MANGINYTGDLPHYVLERLSEYKDRVCDVGNWESWGIPEYADDAIRNAI